MTNKLKNSRPDIQRVEFDALYKLANQHKIDKEYVDAIEIYNKLISKQKDTSECVECAKLYEDVGDIYYELKDFQHAFEFMQKALQIYADNNLYDLQLDQYKKIGGLQQGIWQFKKAIDIFQQGLSLSTRLGKMEKIIEFELLLGNVMNWAEQLEDAEKYLVSAIEKEKKINLPLIKLRAHVSYAILLRKMRKFDQAERFFKLGMKFSAENNNAYLMDITKSYGIMQFEMGNFEAAEPLLLDSEIKAATEGNDTTKAVIFEYLSLLYEKKKEFEKAFYYIKKFYERKLELLEKGFSDDNNILQAKIGLEDAKRERLIAEETASAKSLFIATISHEIRTPMNIILGTSSLMLNDEPKKEHVRYLQTLKKSGENLLGIINDILDVSKMEAGKLEIEYEPVLIQDIFDNILTVMEQSANEKQLQLHYSVDDKINFAFFSDPLRLTQIITNLVSNAIKFTAKGSIHFEAKLKNKNTLQLIVSDTGIGIPNDKLKTIFAQYEQVRTKVQKKYKGTGLGLAISKKLVELMNGTIIIKSKINQGTSFVISLPFEKAAMQKSTTTELHQKDTVFLKGKTILITDDIEDNRFVIAETLRFFNKDIIVLEAEDGQQALDLLKNNLVDFVIMDLDMPVMNGFEALSEIRKNKKLKHLKVIASTASLITNGEDEFLEFGFNGYLPKPFDIDNFFLLLEKMLK
ncbi:MAG TPA: ATP-binding protein [Chitinophagales bacterium]|mgnify:FL=1|nr:ATP-binding protein [Chitinophagales bacterium]